MTEVWVSLDVYGPQSEIERFRKLCLAPALRGANVKGALDIVRVVRDLADSEPTSTAIAWFGEAWNLREDAQESTGSFGCGFDMTEFHEELFHCLAREFPALAFHCGCIGSDNEFMGYASLVPGPARHSPVSICLMNTGRRGLRSPILWLIYSTSAALLPCKARPCWRRWLKREMLLKIRNDGPRGQPAERPRC